MQAPTKTTTVAKTSGVQLYCNVDNTALSPENWIFLHINQNSGALSSVGMHTSFVSTFAHQTCPGPLMYCHFQDIMMGEISVRPHQLTCPTTTPIKHSIFPWPPCPLLPSARLNSGPPMAQSQPCPSLHRLTGQRQSPPSAIGCR